MLALAVCIDVAIGSAAHAGEAADAAGFIIAYDLKGADLARGTAVIRQGEELRPQLWMPIFQGDTVFIRDSASSVVLDMAKDGRIELAGVEQRLTIGENGSGDSAWEIVTQIAELFSGEEGEDTPTNLISKGDESLSVPMAVHGLNFIVRDNRPIWIAWRGGKAPYNLALDIDDGRQLLGSTAANEAEIGIPDSATDRFAVLIEDSLGKRVRVALALREDTPEMPGDVAKSAAARSAGQAVKAGWLAAQDDGAWRLEAARGLRAMPAGDKTTARLLSALAKGWRPHD
jgi:hypothetical protein